MAESRQELVNWVNDLLLVDITKVEQCGTGAVYCQIFDSIFLDVPMSKVRYDVNSEYQYINNFKILQNTFLKHKIDRVVPVEKLVKCRFQDNLEFLQWSRKFWDGNHPGHIYDPISRRKSAPLPSLSQSIQQPVVRGAGSNTPQIGGGARTTRATSTFSSNTRPPSSTSRVNSGAARPPSVQRGVTAGPASIKPLKDKISHLEAEHEQLVNTVDILEAERNFYYDKLFNIELLIQSAVDDLDKTKNGTTSNDINGEKSNGTTLDSNEKEDESKISGDDGDGTNLHEDLEKLSIEDTYSSLVREIQTILYKTTEGFEIPTQEYEMEETF